MNISPTENEIKYIREALTQFNNERVRSDKSAFAFGHIYRCNHVPNTIVNPLKGGAS